MKKNILLILNRNYKVNVCLPDSKINREFAQEIPEF